MASERLRELQEMEQRIHQDSGADEVQSVPREVNLGAGSFRVMDQNEAEIEENKALLRRKLAAKDDRISRLGSWRLWAVVSVTIISCIALLWALFSGSLPEKYSSTTTCVDGRELKRQADDGKRFNACPEDQWLPRECMDERRTKSRSAMEQCNVYFADCGYSLGLLKDCGLLV